MVKKACGGIGQGNFNVVAYPYVKIVFAKMGFGSPFCPNAQKSGAFKPRIAREFDKNKRVERRRKNVFRKIVKRVFG